MYKTYILLILFTSHILFSEENLEDIKVEGIRNNINNTLELKKNNISKSDIIMQESIGSFPDKNIAEAISRMPGTSIIRDFGEGSTVSIYGLNPSLNVTQLNGQSLGTSDWFILNKPERNFNFELLSSSLISKVKIEKSAQANHDEGAIGGVIMMETYNPLDLNNTVHSSIDMQYNNKSKKWDPSGSLIYNWKNEEETLGATVGLSYEQRTVERDGTEVFGFIDPVDNAELQAPEGSTDKGIVPFATGSSLFQQKRERLGMDVSLQWLPTDNMVTTFHHFSSKMNADNQNQNLITFTANDLLSGGGHLGEVRLRIT